jgi:RND family efflux transporter MFP subunit
MSKLQIEIIASIAALTLISACRGANTYIEPIKPQTVSAPVPIVQPEQIQEPKKDGFLGTIMSRETVDIAAKFEGRLNSVNFALGDSVSRNAVIATLDATPIEQELVMAQASLRVAQAERRKAELSLGEAKERHARRVFLAKNGIFSEEQLKDTQYQVDLAEANLEVAGARIAEQAAYIAQLKDKLANTEIRSPYDGMISVRHQNPGAVISRGTPIVSLIRSNDLWVRFAVPMERAIDVTVGSAIAVEVQGLNLSVPGAIEQIAPGVDTALQMLIVEARLKIPSSSKKQIKPGMVGRVLIN